MSAELVDPFATPAHQPLLTDVEWLAIRDEIWSKPWEDPARFPECLRIAVDALGLIGVQSEPYAAQVATQALRSMVQRTVLGGPPEQDLP